MLFVILILAAFVVVGIVAALSLHNSSLKTELTNVRSQLQAALASGIKSLETTASPYASGVLAMVGGELKTFATKELAKAAVEAQSIVPKALTAFETYAGNEFDKLLLQAESSLMNTAPEDADIAAAQQKIADAQSSKAERLARAVDHVAKLQAHIDSQRAGS